MQKTEPLSPLSSLEGRKFPVPVNLTTLFAIMAFQASLLLIGLFISPVIALGIFLGVLYVVLCLVNLKWAWAAIIFLFPFSREISFKGFSSALQIPTEPLCFIFVFIWLLHALLNKRTGFVRSPLVVPVLLFLLLPLLSLLYSDFWIRTGKAWLNLCWYVLIGFIFPLNNLKTEGDVKFVLKVLFSGIVVVCSFAMLYLFFPGLHVREVQTGIVPDLFFVDHGAYSAYVSFYFALALAFFIGSRNEVKRLQWFAVVLLAGLAVLLSFARAAWLGIIVLFLFIGIVKRKDLLKFRNAYKVAVILLFLFFVLGSMGFLSSIEQHATTISDVEANVSNLERFHRWMVAINMFKDHPVLGVGTGTYEENYASYKIRSLTTPISTMYAGVHSEYLTVLSENGLVGFVVWMAMIIALFAFGRKVYTRTHNRFVRNCILGLLGGFSTYLVHGLFNDYLSFDKVAIPFWLSFGLIAVLGNIVNNEWETRAQEAVES